MTCSYRIGSGYDIHCTTPDRPLILCGIRIPSPLGLLGHSDADVALHALMDALLGAIGQRDIGYHFPDTDERYRGADSTQLLATVMQMVCARLVIKWSMPTLPSSLSNLSFRLIYLR